MMTSGIKALVVDDNPGVVKVTAAMLVVLGFNVQTAEEGQAALFQFLRSPSELVLAGFEMPVINGYQLGRKIKTQAPGTRVVIMTGLGQAAVAGLMKDAGIDGWLFKPFFLEQLKVLLERIGLPTCNIAKPVLKKAKVSLAANHMREDRYEH